MKRILRVLEYVGSDEWVDIMIQSRSVKGSLTVGPNGSIHEAILGEVTQVITESEIAERERQRQKAGL